jgi:hypothetical protein
MVKFMINKQLIIDRLVLIDGYLKELRILASLDKDSFLNDKKTLQQQKVF